VLVATGVVVVSIALAPGRGLVWQAARHARNRRQLRTETVLTDLYALGIQHAGQLHGHDARSIEALGPTRGAVGTALQQLAARGLAEQLPAGGWTLTDGGRAAAKSVLRHRRHTDPDGLDPVTGGD